MIHNDILRNLRYTFDLDDNAMIEVFALGGRKATREEVCSWLKKEESPSFKLCSDKDMASYLDGFIELKRGKQEKNPSPKTDEVSKTEGSLDNNVILKKLKIALNLKGEDMMSILSLVQVKLSKHELSALFRKKDHKNYRECKDQFLRNFLRGLQKKYRP